MASGDIVFIEGLQVETVIGVFNWERSIKQTLLLDIEMSSDIEVAAKTDELDQALDYAAVAERVLAFGQSSQFKLIETFAERLIELIFSEFAVAEIKLTLRKPHAVKQAASVGLAVQRSR